MNLCGGISRATGLAAESEHRPSTVVQSLKWLWAQPGARRRMAYIFTGKLNDDGAAQLPERLLAKDGMLLSRMRFGGSGWVAPWSMYVDCDGYGYLRDVPYHANEPSAGKPGYLCVERDEEGRYHVDTRFLAPLDQEIVWEREKQRGKRSEGDIPVTSFL